MRIESDVKLDFKDVLIRPKRSTLGSRNAVDVDRTFRFLHTGGEWSGFPLIAANMDVTGTMAMARALGQRGALTALHKHYPEDELAKFFASEDGVHAFYSLGTTRGRPRQARRGAQARAAAPALPRRRQRLRREVPRDRQAGARRKPAIGDHGGQRRHRRHDARR